MPGQRCCCFVVVGASGKDLELELAGDEDATRLETLHVAVIISREIDDST